MLVQSLREIASNVYLANGLCDDHDYCVRGSMGEGKIGSVEGVNERLFMAFGTAFNSDNDFR